MKNFFTGILVLVLSLNNLYAQRVTVADKLTRMGIPGVTVYAKGSYDTLETNKYGEVYLDIFPDNAPIVFVHPFYETVILTKRQLERHEWLVLLPRGAKLMASQISMLSAKEYSFGLPFYVNIINLDNNSDFTDEDQGALEKIMFKSDEKGITVFRSVEPNKILLALDGLRLNNAIYKNGKIESAVNFEKTIVQNVQQIFDPTFLIYGPDGLGGVIHYFTKIPNLSNDYKPVVHGGTTHRYETASKSWISNYQVSFSTHKFSSFTSITYSDFGDIMSGKNRKNLPADDSLYGLLLYKVERFGDRDSIVPNSNPYLQLGTNYRQLFVLQKFRYKVNSGIYLFSNFYYTHTSDLGIYSGLTEINIDHPRFAVCSYLPTNKLININKVYIQKSNRFFDFGSILLGGQYIEEYRLTRKFNNPVELHQIERLFVTDFNADFVKIFNISRLAYGFQFTYNNLKSNAFFHNIETDSTWFGLTRYPTNGSFSQWYSVYMHYRNMSNSRLFIDLAARLDAHDVIARFSNQPPQLPLPFTKVDTMYFAPSFAVSLDGYPVPGWQVKATFTKSTHIPVIDDFAKVMFKDFVTTIPVKGLLPESSFYSELSNTFTVSKYARFQITAFNSYIHNLIMLVDTTLNGADSLYLGQDGYEIAAKRNIPKARIYGFSMSFNLNIPISEKFYGKYVSVFNFTKGQNLSDSLPVPNVAPYFGRNTLSFFYKSMSFSITHIYNGPKPRNELSPVGEDYIEKAASEGFLPWQIFNLKLQYNAGRKYSFSFGINNIFDTFYRPYASAINGTGRNFIFTGKISF